VGDASRKEADGLQFLMLKMGLFGLLALGDVRGDDPDAPAMPTPSTRSSRWASLSRSLPRTCSFSFTKATVSGHARTSSHPGSLARRERIEAKPARTARSLKTGTWISKVNRACDKARRMAETPEKLKVHLAVLSFPRHARMTSNVASSSMAPAEMPVVMGPSPRAITPHPRCQLGRQFEKTLGIAAWSLILLLGRIREQHRPASKGCAIRGKGYRGRGPCSAGTSLGADDPEAVRVRAPCCHGARYLPVAPPPSWEAGTHDGGFAETQESRNLRINPEACLSRWMQRKSGRQID